MPVRMPLPPGCYGMKMQSDGREYNATPGGTVVMEDHHAEEIKYSAAGINGILTARRLTRLATKRGRVCTNPDCSKPNNIWQVWTTICPACGAETEEAH